MKKKIAFWVVIFLANAVIGVISVKTYQKLEARITGVETYQKNFDEAYQKKYGEEFESLKSAYRKTVAELSRALGVDGKYDFNNNLARIWDLNMFFDYKADVVANVVLEVPEELRKLSPDSSESNVKIGSKSPGMIIGRYVLMASHPNDPELFSRQTINVVTPNGALKITFNSKVLKYNITLFASDGSEHSLKELYRNREKDFSLFEIPVLLAGKSKDAKALNFPFEIGKSNELRIGHFIYMNGRPRIDSEVARPGYVTSLVTAVPDGVLKVIKDNNEFGLSQSTDDGDSSSPIMAFRDGRPELVGIYLGWIAGTDNDNGDNTRSRALKINIAVDEIKEKLGIDLRELQRQILHKQ